MSTVIHQILVNKTQRSLWRLFKPDTRLSPDKRFEALIFINGDKDFENFLFLFNQYSKGFVAVE